MPSFHLVLSSSKLRLEPINNGQDFDRFKSECEFHAAIRFPIFAITLQGSNRSKLLMPNYEEVLQQDLTQQPYRSDWLVVANLVVRCSQEVQGWP